MQRVKPCALRRHGPASTPRMYLTHGSKSPRIFPALISIQMPNVDVFMEICILCHPTKNDVISCTVKLIRYESGRGCKVCAHPKVRGVVGRLPPRHSPVPSNAVYLFARCPPPLRCATLMFIFAASANAMLSASGLCWEQCRRLIFNAGNPSAVAG